MELKLAEFIVQRAIESGYYDEEDVHVYTKYSGRGMFGVTTAGVVGLTPGEVACLMLTVAQQADLRDEMSTIENIPSKFQQDDLGLSVVIY